MAELWKIIGENKFKKLIFLREIFTFEARAAAEFQKFFQHQFKLLSIF